MNIEIPVGYLERTDAEKWRYAKAAIQFWRAEIQKLESSPAIDTDREIALQG